MIRVQIAEDDSRQSSLLKNYLTKEEMEITVITTDGYATIDSYLKNSPDILILDIDLPKKNGIEVIDYLTFINAKEQNKCNIIILSGSLPRFDLINTSKVYKIFRKPTAMEEVVDTIREIASIKAQLL